MFPFSLTTLQKELYTKMSPTHTIHEEVVVLALTEQVVYNVGSVNALTRLRSKSDLSGQLKERRRL